MPQLRALNYIGPDLEVRSAQRIAGEIIMFSGNVRGDEAITAMVRAAVASREPAWIPPLFRQVLGQTVIARGQPVIRNGQVVGVLVAVIGTEELSDYVGRLGRESHATAFILYGRDRVLAHAHMRAGTLKPTQAVPLPALDRFGDPVLAALWDERRNSGRLFASCWRSWPAAWPYSARS
jgi:hypothetical protein